jgi:hypothetical protein
MPPWRETAYELLPELAEKITDPEIDTPYLLWFEIRDAFARAYDASPRDESLISRIYQYADWCMTAPRGENGDRRFGDVHVRLLLRAHSATS